MKQKIFRKLMDELLAAKTEDEINAILYRNTGYFTEDGVDMAYQHETITWEDHERLFTLAARLSESLKA